MPFYIQVYNSAMKAEVSFEKINPATLAEALEYKEQLKREYGQIGCHEVRLLVELAPEEEEETETCDLCQKDKPSEGFDSVILFHGDRDNPPEYGRMCKDCQTEQANLEQAAGLALEPHNDEEEADTDELEVEE